LLDVILGFFGTNPPNNEGRSHKNLAHGVLFFHIHTANAPTAIPAFSVLEQQAPFLAEAVLV
jgi:hypothetical protein